MQIKSIAMMVAAGCAIGILTGCGVPQEEVDQMLAQKDSEHKEAMDKVQTELENTKSLLKASDGKVRTLNSDLTDSSVLNDELKQNLKDVKGDLATAQSKISSLESQLESAKASIKSAQAMAADAQSNQATAEMEAKETQRRFEALIENLIRLNKIKPEDVGFDQLSGDMGSMDMGDDSMDMGGSSSMDSTDMGDSQGSSDAASLLDEMGNM